MPIVIGKLLCGQKRCHKTKMVSQMFILTEIVCSSTPESGNLSGLSNGLSFCNLSNWKVVTTLKKRRGKKEANLTAKGSKSAGKFGDGLP